MDQSTGAEQTLGVGTGLGRLGLLPTILKTQQTGTASLDWGRKDADPRFHGPFYVL